MKLFAIAFGGIGLAQVSEKWSRNGGRSGKHGRTDVSNNDRWIWSYPLCMTVPNHASCDNDCKADYTSESGSIVIRPKDYKDYQSCLWTIRVPSNKKLLFNFDKKIGFNVEYHHKCGYDRLHIFSGTISGAHERHARFCGPKKGDKPYDGSGKIKETNGIMPFWDEKYDLGSNEAIIGFDVDQKYVGKGFTLRWNAVDANEIDFNNVYEAHSYLDQKLRAQMVQILFPKDKQKSKYQKKIAKLLEKSKRAIENNPSGSGKKKRRCAKPEDESVTPLVVGMIKDVFADSAATFDETIAAMVALLGEFLGRCKVASKSWPVKLAKLATQLESERCPVGTDCRL